MATVPLTTRYSHSFLSCLFLWPNSFSSLSCLSSLLSTLLRLSFSFHNAVLPQHWNKCRQQRIKAVRFLVKCRSYIVNLFFRLLNPTCEISLLSYSAFWSLSGYCFLVIFLQASFCSQLLVRRFWCHREATALKKYWPERLKCSPEPCDSSPSLVFCTWTNTRRPPQSWRRKNQSLRCRREKGRWKDWERAESSGSQS